MFRQFKKQILVATLSVSAVIFSLLLPPTADGQTQVFDDGSTQQIFDDGSTLAVGTDGSVSSSPSTDGGSGAGGSGAADAGGTTNSCASDKKTADMACLMPGTSGMDSGESAMYTMMMNQLVQTGAQIASIGKNMSQQCKLQADVSKIMGSINGVKGGACMKMINSCGESCTEESNQNEQAAARFETSNPAAAQTYKNAARLNRRDAAACKAHSTQVGAMMMGAMQNLANFAANKSCADSLAAYVAPPPTATLPPIANVGDCSDPNNSSLACMCSRPGNATSVMCAGFGSGTLAGGGTSVTPNGSTVASPVGSTVADATDGNTVDPFAIPKNGGSGGEKGQGDGGSGAPGGGGISALSSEGGGSGGGGDPRSAITGTSGGTGSGLGGSGGGGGLARNNGAAGAKDGFFDKFNLKKFLPGSKYKTRGIAGMSVKSVDGITGPMGPTLWEKATRQYQEQIQKQNVILEK